MGAIRLLRLAQSLFGIGMGEAPPLPPPPSQVLAPSPTWWAVDSIKCPKEQEAAVRRNGRMSSERGQQPQPGGRRGRGDKKSRRRGRRKETYSVYIYKVLKQVRAGSQRRCVRAWGCVEHTGRRA